MEPMKISFGFSKLSKKTNIISNNVKLEEKKVELIECLEGQSIKVKDAVEEVKQPLVIPLKDNEKNLLDRIRAAKHRSKQADQNKDEPEDTRLDSELTVDELAVRQLIKEAKDRLVNGSSTDSKVSVLPLNSDTVPLEGEKEPTLEDYESVPISDYGLALLRGMGWKDGMGLGKNATKTAAVNLPELRPKGLGLGATKVVQSEMPAKKAVDKDGNVLGLVKGGYAKVIAGPQKGNYCEIQGFDEEAGRVIIKVYPKAEIVNINEIMLVPVVKEEFSKGSKIINNAKYEEYKEMSDKKLENFRIKSESSGSKQIKKETNNSDDEKNSKRNARKLEKMQEHSKSRYKSHSPESDHEREKQTSKYRERSKSPSRHHVSRNSDRKNIKEERKSRSKSNDKSRNCSSSKYSSKRDSGADSSSSSDAQEESTKNRKKHSGKYETKQRRSRSKSRSSSKKDKAKQYSSDEDYYEKDKKNKKHTKSKNRDRSRSKSKDRHKKSKKHSSQHKDSSDSDTDHKKDKRKKNKCKSRHRRNSSSSSEDRTRDRRHRSRR